MSFTGHVQDGAVVMDEPLPLPNGTAVEVNPKPAVPLATAGGKPRTLNERLKQFIGCIKDGPEDGALQHDHYLYGTPKR
jgi:hypothetical protein